MLPAVAARPESPARKPGASPARPRSKLLKTESQRAGSRCRCKLGARQRGASLQKCQRRANANAIAAPTLETGKITQTERTPREGGCAPCAPAAVAGVWPLLLTHSTCHGKGTAPLLPAKGAASCRSRAAQHSAPRSRLGAGAEPSGAWRRGGGGVVVRQPLCQKPSANWHTPLARARTCPFPLHIIQLCRTMDLTPLCAISTNTQ